MDKNKLKLTFLLLIAALPISLATWYFGTRELEGVSATTNKGVLHVRLSKEFERVERVYVQVSDAPGPLPEATAALLAAQQPDMKVVYTGEATLRDLLRGAVAPGSDPISMHYIYVVDPVGNVMLYFTPVNTPEDILSDLDKLLDHSSLG